MDSISKLAHDLTDTVQDASLEDYLSSIEDLFTKITSQSQVFLSLAAKCVARHHECDIWIVHLLQSIIS